MANTIISPNMQLPVPVPTVDPGPQYSFDLQACLNLIDSHNHSAGSGVPITPAGLNINSDLSFGSNNAILLRSVRLAPQVSPIAGATDLGCVYVSGVDLYYNDRSGNQVRITQSGGVAGSPGSISSLSSPASASYVSANSTFVWQSAASTPANLDAGSLILRNLTANSKGLTLNPPSAMGANYSLTLPALPSAKSLMTLDTSGNMAVRAFTSKVVSSSSGFQSTSSATPSAITNLSVTITTTGGEVLIFLQPDGTTGAASEAFIGVSGPTNSIVGKAGFYIYKAGSAIGGVTVLAETTKTDASNTVESLIPPGSLLIMDSPGAGTFTYAVYFTSLLTSSTAQVNNCVLVAKEIV